MSSFGLTNLLGILSKIKDFEELHLEENKIDDQGMNFIKTIIKSGQYKIFVTKSLINKEVFKDEALGKETKLILV